MVDIGGLLSTLGSWRSRVFRELRMNRGDEGGRLRAVEHDGIGQQADGSGAGFEGRGCHYWVTVTSPTIVVGWASHRNW